MHPATVTFGDDTTVSWIGGPPDVETVLVTLTLPDGSTIDSTGCAPGLAVAFMTWKRVELSHGKPSQGTSRG